MESAEQHDREVRAARNQALFRAVNEKIEALNASFASVTETFTIACECADRNCIEMLDIDPDEYVSVRANPRHFAVARGHVYPDVEIVVRESERYVFVEKIGTAADVAEMLQADQQAR